MFDRVEIVLDRRYAKGRKFVVTTGGECARCLLHTVGHAERQALQPLLHSITRIIVRGGELHFVLGRTPNKQWGVE